MTTSSTPAPNPPGRMRPLFVDTSGWMACADAADPFYKRCRAARDEALRGGRALITTDVVMDETLTLIRVRLGIDAAVTWWRQIDGSRRLKWERVDAARFDRARELFFSQRDRGYSFTDCTSFAIMRELRLRDALATDKHFVQAGFETIVGDRSRRPRRPRA